VLLLCSFHTRSSSSVVDAAAAAAFAAAAAVTWGTGGVGSEKYARRDDQLQSKELRNQLEKIAQKKKNSNSLSFRHLQPTERQEIEMLTRNLCKFHGSPISLDDMHEYLPGSSWRLAFSTRDEIFAQQLPSVDATIHWQFHPNDKKEGNDSTSQSQQHVDYMIKFHNKSRKGGGGGGGGALSGVDTLKMGCSWQAAAGLVVFEDDEDDDNAEEKKGGGESSKAPLAVLEDIYNRNVNRKGLFMGRSRFIKTTYFDGDVWIECGKQQPQQSDGSNNSNKSFTNIYLRENYEQHFEYSI
jgi:hypothetical protein